MICALRKKLIRNSKKNSKTGTFIGNIGGALGANVVGNREAVEKVNVLKYVGTLMNV